MKLQMLYWASRNRPREKIDHMFFTYCILQNMLNSYDGLGTQESGVDWMGRDGMHGVYYCDLTADDSGVGMSGRKMFGSGSEQVLEVEHGFDELRNKLITHLLQFFRREGAISVILISEIRQYVMVFCASAVQKICFLLWLPCFLCVLHYEELAGRLWLLIFVSIDFCPNNHDFVPCLCF
ncbi:unnamed protein product [Discosporangium mesarthrocarpum]